MKTQLGYIYLQLIKKGKISRNHCLQKYISRLGARICDLRKTGLDIEGRYEKTRNGQDYVYYLLNTRG